MNRDDAIILIGNSHILESVTIQIPHCDGDRRASGPEPQLPSKRAIPAPEHDGDLSVPTVLGTHRGRERQIESTVAIEISNSDRCIVLISSYQEADWGSECTIAVSQQYHGVDVLRAGQIQASITIEVTRSDGREPADE